MESRAICWSIPDAFASVIPRKLIRFHSRTEGKYGEVLRDTWGYSHVWLDNGECTQRIDSSANVQQRFPSRFEMQR